LVDAFEGAAAALFEAPAVALRAKGVRYHGSTSWHSDSSDAEVASIGFAAYLEPLDGGSGALRVVPGSHRPDYGAAVLAYGARSAHSTSPTRKRRRCGHGGAPRARRRRVLGARSFGKSTTMVSFFEGRASRLIALLVSLLFQIACGGSNQDTSDGGALSDGS